MTVESWIICIGVLLYISVSFYERYLLKELKRKISRTEKVIDKYIAVNSAIICELDDQKDKVRLRELRSAISDLKFIRSELI